MFAKTFQSFDSSNLMIQQGHGDDVKIFVQIEYLLQVFILHLLPSVHFHVGPPPFLRGPHRGRNQDLVHYNIMYIDTKLRQLLDQPLRLVNGEKLGDANAHECGLVGILERFLVRCMYILAYFNAPR